MTGDYKNPLEDAISRRLSKGQELKQHNISTGYMGYSDKGYEDKSRQARLDALVPQIAPPSFSMNDFGALPETAKILQLTMPSIDIPNFTMPTLDMPKPPEEQVVSPQQQTQQQQGGGGGGDNNYPIPTRPAPGWNERTPQGNWSQNSQGQQSGGSHGNTNIGGTGLSSGGYFAGSNLMSQNPGQSTLSSSKPPQFSSNNSSSGSGYGSFSSGPY